MSLCQTDLLSKATNSLGSNKKLESNQYTYNNLVRVLKLNGLIWFQLRGSINKTKLETNNIFC